MGISFANPAALWALLGIPALVLIHFLQSRSAPREISTLFLLESLKEEEQKGAVISYFRNSAQFWLQVLAVLWLALLLAQPRWLRRESVQTVAVVLDDSLSMQAFRDAALPEIAQALQQVRAGAAQTEWLLLRSDSLAPPLYQGRELSPLLDAIAAWRPWLNPHDAAPALRRARDRIGPAGLLIWVTAHPPAAPPADALVLGIGHPLPNVSLTGIRVTGGETEADPLRWTATVLNHSGQAATRQLTVEAVGMGQLPPQEIQLAPQGMLTLRGQLPPGARRGILHLDGDALAADNQLPFVAETPKSLQVRTDADHAWAQRVLALLPGVRLDPEAAQVWTRVQGAPPPDRSGVMIVESGIEGPFGEILVESHPLTQGLNWQGFLGRPQEGLALAAGDQPLVWMGALPLVVLRETPAARQLLLAFTPETTNAERLPGVVLTLTRFWERVREQQVAFAARQLETHQRLTVAAAPEGGPLRFRFAPLQGEPQTWTRPVGVLLQAPPEPGFLEIWQGETRLLEAAVSLGDATAGNLQAAAAQALPRRLLAQAQEIHRVGEAWTPLWFALLLGTVLASWWVKSV